MTTQFSDNLPYQEQSWYVAHQKYVRGQDGGARARLEGANLAGANLEGAVLEGANLTLAIMDGASLEEAILNWARLEGASLTQANMTRAQLKEARLTRSNLTWARLKGANLKGANLEGASLTRSILKEANLEEANLVEATLTLAIMDGANLEGANLPPPTALLLCEWGRVSPGLCLDLMRYDAENHPDPASFDRWVAGGECPYENPMWGRAANFKESRAHWSPLLHGERAPTALSLILRLFAEKGIKR